MVEDVNALNAAAATGDQGAFRSQQLLLARIYDLVMKIPDEPTAEGSLVINGILTALERATIAAEDAAVDWAVVDVAPTTPAEYLSWLKQGARGHRVFKHRYYMDFIRHHATAEHLRKYVIQESVVDGRFDDLLALMQVGTAGSAKMEIANNFWDEMGNGKPAEVHTTLFNQLYDVFDISQQELEDSLTATASCRSSARGSGSGCPRSASSTTACTSPSTRSTRRVGSTTSCSRRPTRPTCGAASRAAPSGG